MTETPPCGGLVAGGDRAQGPRFSGDCAGHFVQTYRALARDDPRVLWVVVTAVSLLGVLVRATGHVGESGPSAQFYCEPKRL